MNRELFNSSAPLFIACGDIARQKMHSVRMRGNLAREGDCERERERASERERERERGERERREKERERERAV